ncbi:MAG: 50S ribosomal protein L25/general stress protein Ctc [Myxococcales bacterium]|nr:50S ribosomal protein L25/general stress protein Ctc [Myxococcales bacterium]
MAQDVSTLAAQKRDKSGKGPARQLRMKGLIPAVCYGPYDKPLHVAIDPEAIKKAIATPHKFNTVIKLEVDGQTRTVLFKDFEKDPVGGEILHADFLEVRMDKDVVVNVPVILTGKPVGVTEGGILQQVARTLPVLCKPSDIPEKIEVDVSNLKIAESLHIKDVKAPAGVQFKIRGDQTIAVVNIPEKEEEAPKPAAAAAVPGAEGAPAAAGAAPGAPGAAPGAPGAAGAAPAPGAPAAGAAKAPAADKGAKK